MGRDNSVLFDMGAAGLSHTLDSLVEIGAAGNTDKDEIPFDIRAAGV